MQSQTGAPAEMPLIEINRRLSPITEERVTEVCECVLDIVAALFNVSGRELRETGRSSTSVARVRQIGMYVAHVILGLNMTEVGRGFGRDRTTVQYACHLVEDMRDDDEFDRVVNMTERVTAAAFRHTEVH
ncbi:helix-turn-helix domain-containing protein [Nitratireductor sp. ZSWI3]|uniref:helix-turn-helix domain-containing protein n=1 Tax=Nitratireductor sp. ZSWI3 TaxID=2966359 RepID=UPI0021506437|nr:helix-turn-helix domain-containing protein [Nitratireductor sp. ZSWI3]MCR4265329.1 chromosomal replication initiator DnaA [Nitratireductor sp. ZSWI3]